MKKRAKSVPREILVLRALRRSAKIALQRARRAGVPCYIEENGRIIDIAKEPPPPTKKRRSNVKQKQQRR